MFPILAALFIIIPAIELKLLWEVGGRIGIGPTLALIIFTGIVGAHLARAQGLKVINDIQRDLAGAKLPGDNLISGALVLVGGVLLVTPGILTDFTGLLLMLPPVLISLPFKLMLFVLLDGWQLVVGMLMESFTLFT